MDIPDFTLAAYRRLLETARQAGYEFAGFASIGRERGPHSCLLRHDVDAELLGCDAMLEVERSLGIKATYFVMTRSTSYNLFSVEGRRAVERLLDAGQDVGLHFMGELCEEDSADVLAAKVRAEADWLEREFGTRVHAVSFHQPTRRILDGKVAVDGLVNTYNPSQMGDYFYVSDTNMQWRQKHPAEIFARALHPRLQLLIHPIWWTEETLSVERKWLRVLEANQAAVLGHWQERERTLRDLRLSDHLPANVPPGGGRRDG